MANPRKLRSLALFLAGAAVAVAISHYVPNRAPMLPPASVSTDWWDRGLTSARGTWTNSGGPPMAFPVQTSHLSCFKDIGYCFESVATFRDGLLNSFLNLYTIVNWDERQVTASGNDGLCQTSNSIVIDRVTKSATAIITYGHRDDPMCKDYPAEMRHVLASG
jgi:hypothetical protein